MHGIGERQTARTGDGQAHGLICATQFGEMGTDVTQQSLHRRAHVRMMTTVICEQGGIEGVGIV